MEKIIIYSPVDGTIKPIKELNDGVFSEGMLGEGFYIEPSSKQFYSPIAKGKISQIFDTKHAYFFQTAEGPTFLMHIGLDTVKLNGEPFNLKAKQGDEVNLTTKIVEVNYDILTSKKIAKSTPIVLDTNQFPNWHFKMYKFNSSVKHGEPIGEFVYEVKQTETGNNDLAELTLEEKMRVIIEAKGKYDLVGEKIYHLIGSKTNYTKLFHCMTRLRIEVIDKSLINEAEIKKINLVKGINWAGNQMQIIIGGDVYKVDDAINKYLTNLENHTKQKVEKQKEKISSKIMGAISAIIIPALPAIMTAGLLGGLKAVLLLSGAIVEVNLNEVNQPGLDFFSIFMNIVSGTGLKLIGVFVGYNTMKYLGGPTITQLMLSLAIAGAIWGTGWAPDLTLFSINGFEIKAGIYASSIIPHIGSAFLLFYVDKWIKIWMPATIDIIFRPMLAFVGVFAIMFFAVGPVLFLFEQGLGQIVNQIIKIPYGFGVAIFAFTWTPLVLTGMHSLVSTPISLVVLYGDPTVLWPAINIAVFSQMGATVGVALQTKSSRLRSIAIASLPGGIFGVNDVILYGINLPKVRPFWIGCIAAAIMGLLSGLLGVETRVAAGQGILAVTGQISVPLLTNISGTGIISTNNILTGAPNSLIWNTVLWFVVNLGAIPVAALISYFIYIERLPENKDFKKVNSELIKYYALVKGIKTKEAKAELKDKISTINDLIIVQDMSKIKEVEKKIIKITQTSSKLEKLIAYNEKKQENITKKIKKLAEKNMEENRDKIAVLITQTESLINNEKVNKLELELAELNKLNVENMNWLTKWQNDICVKVNKLVEEIAADANNNDLKHIGDSYWNAAHSVDISYFLNAARDKMISKKTFKHLQTK